MVTTEAEQELVLSQPWLKSSVAPTGSVWGRRIADVVMSRLPQNLLGQVMMVPSDPKNVDSEPLKDEVVVVIFRWDRFSHKGWDESFTVTLTFPDERIFEVEIPLSSRIADGHTVRVQLTSGTLLRERPRQVGRSIPRIIFNLSAPLHKQPSQPIRRLLKNVRRMTDLMQCTSLFLVIEDEAGRQEVESSGIPNFLEAYNSLLSGAYKADLLRYYLLYKYGGVYMDDKTFLRYSLDSAAFDHLLGAREEQKACEMFIGVVRGTEISFMGARRGCPIMLKALEKAIDNIMNRFYGNHRLSITGNIMFEKIMRAGGALTNLSPEETASELQEVWDSCWEERVAILPIAASAERIMNGDDIFWQRQAIPSADWPKGPTYYANLWNQYLVYTDRNPERPLLRPPMAADTRRKIIAYSLTIAAILGMGFIINNYPPIW